MDLSINGKQPVAAWIPSLDTTGNGTATLHDLIGGNDGDATLHADLGWQVVDGRRAIFLNSNAHKVAIPHDPALEPANLTLSIWYRQESFPSSFACLVSKSHSAHSAPFYNYHIRLDNPTQLRSIVVADSFDSPDSAITQVESKFGRWHYVAMTFDGNTFNSYFDGLLVATQSNVGAIAYSQQPLHFGTFPNLTTGRFHGYLDDIRLWDQALTGKEIEAQFKRGRGHRNTPNLSVRGKRPAAAYIPTLDTEGDGSVTLTDLVGNADGTLTNMSPTSDWISSSGKRALDFDGNNDYVLTELSVPDDWTISLWLYPRDSANALQCAIGSKFGTAGGVFFEYDSIGGAWGWLDSVSYVSGNVLDRDVWHHLTVTQTGDIITLYENGVAVASESAVATDIDNLRIAGRGDGSGTKYGNCLIDDVRIYDETLADKDVATLYKLGRGETINTLTGRVAEVVETIKEAARPLGPIHMWGDSLTNGASSADKLGTLTGRSVTYHHYGGETSYQIADRYEASTPSADTTIFWAGRNNFRDRTGWHNEIQRDLRRMVDHLGHQKFLIYMPHNGNFTTEYKGTAAHDEILELEYKLLNQYGLQFFNVRRHTIDNWNYDLTYLAASFVQPGVDGTARNIQVDDGSVLPATGNIRIGYLGHADKYQINSKTGNVINVTLKEQIRIAPSSNVENFTTSQGTSTPTQTSTSKLSVMSDTAYTDHADDTVPRVAMTDNVHLGNAAHDAVARAVQKRLELLRI